MNGQRLVADYLEDIHKACRKAMEFLADMPLGDFAVDDKTAFAVMRALEIVGEASKRIPQTIRDKYPDVPWRSMAGIRDKLSHDYLTIDMEVVWKTVKEDLPALTPRLQIIAEEARGIEEKPN
ncbi:MAG TPA: DUF86 domain-containing protein [Pirellulales bacterium]|jgi:uncharacterized protein with HEPN domain|nr:DUF86 domain-containing protein [Pirellulales bacterium]